MTKPTTPMLAASCCHEGQDNHALHGNAKPLPGVKYSCPMCSGVKSDKPGDCPKCGMALELKTVIGDKVTGGTANGTGGFVMHAENIGSDTLLAQIVNLVAEAQRSRAPIQGLAGKVATIFVPAVVAVAVLTFALRMIFGPEPRLAYAIVNAVAVLIIACPCVLGLQ